MVRCPYCGSRFVKVLRPIQQTLRYEERPKKKLRHWKTGKEYTIHPRARIFRKLGDVYKCLICEREFDYIEESKGYLTDCEKEDLIERLMILGLKDVARKVQKRKIRIHRKSLIGNLYEDIKRQT